MAKAERCKCSGPLTAPKACLLISPSVIGKISWRPPSPNLDMLAFGNIALLYPLIGGVRVAARRFLGGNYERQTASSGDACGSGAGLD